jgi:hypothetical protein
VTELATRIPAPPPIESGDRPGPLELAGRLVVACGWGTGAIAAVGLVLAGAVAAAAVAVGLTSAQAVAAAWERVMVRRPTVSARPADLPAALAKTDLG